MIEHNDFGLHVVHARVPGPLSELLAEKEEDDTERAPQENQRHVGHDWWDESSRNRPWRNELGESVTPNVLVHSNGDHDRSCYRFVAVDSVCCDNGRNGSNLNTSTGVADYDNWLFRLC